MEPIEETFRVRKVGRVESKVAPLMRRHPETIKVEDVQGNIPVLHALDELGDRRFVIRSQERGG